jgi:glycosyltransferase involved in cell wall biosynthesis
MTASGQSLSVVLPAYNEVENIKIAVERALAVLPSLVADHEVVVVDDGSRDGTAEAVLVLLEAHPGRVRLIRHTQNLGYGAAIRTGFQRARGDLVFYTDADNQFDIGELKWFLPLISEYDVVVGFRVYRYDPVLRSILSWVYNRLVNVLFRVRVRDVDCAFKLFRREVIEKVRIDATDFFVDTELVARARRWNFRIVEKGVRHYPRTAGATTVRPSHVGQTLRTIARMWRRIYFPNAGMLEESAALQHRLSELTHEVHVPSISH